MQNTVPRQSYLDALRGYAILLVILVHSTPSSLSSFSAVGARGVQLFFVVSAITLMMSWHERNEHALAFYVRRVFRIAPAFWLAILFYLSMYGTGPRANLPEGIAPWHVVATAAFLHGFHPDTINSIVPGDWSIADEMLFYLLFPALASAFTTLPRALWALGICLLIAATYWWAFHVKGLAYALFPDSAPSHVKDFVFLSFPFQMSAFFAGIAAYQSLPIARKLSRFQRESLLVLCLACFVMLAFAKANLIHGFAVLFAVIAFVMSAGAGAWLNNRPMRYIGRVSYSCYLLHFAVIHILSEAPLLDELPLWASAVARFSVVTMISVALASLGYFFIEEPMIRVGGRVAQKIETRNRLLSEQRS